MKAKAVTRANPAPGPLPVSSEGPDHYRVKDALHTLKRAEEIQRDRSLMRMVKKCAKDEMKALAKVATGKRPK